MLDLNRSKSESSRTSDMRTEITDSEPESQPAENDDRQSESSGLSALLEDLGLDRDFLVNECGCMERAVLTDDGKLDQFLVLKAILDKNLAIIRRNFALLESFVRTFSTWTHRLFPAGVL